MFCITETAVFTRTQSESDQNKNAVRQHVRLSDDSDAIRLSLEGKSERDGCLVPSLIPNSVHVHTRCDGAVLVWGDSTHRAGPPYVSMTPALTESVEVESFFTPVSK